MKLKFNSSKKRKGVKTRPDLTLQSLEEFRSKPSACHTNLIHKLLGISTPLTVCLKLAMKRIMETVNKDIHSIGNKKVNCDQVVTQEMNLEWYKLIRVSLKFGDLYFPHSP